MKNIFKSILVAVAISTFSLAPKVSVAQDEPVTLQTFYDQLAPYGQWIDYPNYGYVFIPNAGPGFIPYSTAGHWEYTDQYGWTWASDYAWGWACFHYGRWNYDPSYGWFWVPDTEWGPAWVVWRNSNEYYGWAPLPSGVDINVGINDGYGIPPQEWCFVSNQRMGDPYLYNYYLPRENNDLFISHSAVIFRMHYDDGHRYSYFAGPDRYEVERYRHQPIQPVVINYNSDPHHVRGDHELPIYRPAVTVVRHDDEHHDDGHHDDGHHDDGHRDDGHHDDHHDAPAPVRVVNVQQVPQRGYNHGNDNHGGNNNNGNNNRGGNNQGNNNNGGNNNRGGGNNQGNNNGNNNRGGGNNQGNNNSGGNNNRGGNDHHGHH